MDLRAAARIKKSDSQKQAGGATLEGLWDFSVRAYGTTGVSGACLVLQNSHGADVNMILYCCWIAGRLGKFDSELLSRATELSSDWGANVVTPLRSARSWMRDAGCSVEPVPTEKCLQLREAIKALELAAEKLQLEALESLLAATQASKAETPRAAENALANLEYYAEAKDFDFNDNVRSLCAIVISAAYPDVDVDVVR